MNQPANALLPITEIPDIGLTLTDGCRLSARVWMPDNAADAPVPVILEYLPYRKRDGTCARDALTHPWLARRGYACVRVDMRGNGDSHGVMADEYTAQELEDAVEVITHLAAQPWCSGTVGMMGISWGGFNALQVAALQPEPLKAIITLCSTVDRYADDIHYKGGCLLNENLGWGATMWAYSSRAPDPALRPDWREIWLQRLEAEPFLPSLWLRHQRRDAYWRHGSVGEDYGAIRVPTLAIGGWGDAYKNAVPALVENLAHAKGIIGPWVHKYPHFAVPEPRIGFLQEALRWWDRWLKDIDNGAENDPAYRTYLMDGVRPKAWYRQRPGHWLVADKTPAHLATKTLHFGPHATLTNTPAQIDQIVASPQHCGMAAGEYCAIWLGPEMPVDQRPDDAYSALFIGAPLAEPLDITGAPTIRLHLSSDQPQAQIAVRLNHIHPDGASTRITYGVLNLSHRDTHATPQTMTPGTPTDITLTLDHIAYRVPAGHRIAIAVSNAYWPLLWPAPHAARLTLTSGSITLAVTPPSSADQWAFPPADADTPWRTTTLRRPDNARTTTTDLKTGLVTLTITDDFGQLRDADHGLISGSIARETWIIHPDDPLSARGKTHWTTELIRDEIILRTETYAEMWADAEQFHLIARLEAYQDDKLVFAKDVSDMIARDHI